MMPTAAPIPRTTDELALLAAVRAAPDEDTPRLMLADCIEERDPARAELIRVQCELSAYGSPVPNTDRVCELAHRERALLDANSDRWRRGPRCEACGGKGGWKRIGGGGLAGRDPQCPDCWNGDAGGLMRKFTYTVTPPDAPEQYAKLEPVRMTAHRGMWRIEVPRAADVWEAVPQDPRLGLNVRMEYKTPPPIYRPTAWARAVCRHHPDVCELWVSDKKPFHYTDAPSKCGWSRDRPTYRDAQTNVLPPAIWDLLPHGNVYPTADTARTELARAAVLWVHAAPPGE